MPQKLKRTHNHTYILALYSGWRWVFSDSWVVFRALPVCLLLPGLPWPHHVDHDLDDLSTRSVFLLQTSPSFSPPAPCLSQRHLKLNTSKAELLLSPRPFLLHSLSCGGTTNQRPLRKHYLTSPCLSSPICKGVAITAPTLQGCCRGSRRQHLQGACTEP